MEHAVIVVGLVSAGLLSLRQAIGIVMGANIGTTVTSFMIGFKLGDYKSFTVVRFEDFIPWADTGKTDSPGPNARA